MKSKKYRALRASTDRLSRASHQREAIRLARNVLTEVTDDQTRDEATRLRASRALTELNVVWYSIGERHDIELLVTQHLIGRAHLCRGCEDAEETHDDNCPVGWRLGDR